MQDGLWLRNRLSITFLFSAIFVAISGRSTAQESSPPLRLDLLSLDPRQPRSEVQLDVRDLIQSLTQGGIEPSRASSLLLASLPGEGAVPELRVEDKRLTVVGTEAERELISDALARFRREGFQKRLLHVEAMSVPRDMLIRYFAKCESKRFDSLLLDSDRSKQFLAEIESIRQIPIITLADVPFFLGQKGSITRGWSYRIELQFHDDQPEWLIDREPTRFCEINLPMGALLILTDPMVQSPAIAEVQIAIVSVRSCRLEDEPNSVSLPLSLRTLQLAIRNYDGPYLFFHDRASPIGIMAPMGKINDPLPKEPSELEMLTAVESKLCTSLGNGWTRSFLRYDLEEIDRDIEPQKFFPLIGQAIHVHVHYRCRLDYAAEPGLPDFEEFYLDHHQLQRPR